MVLSYEFEMKDGKLVISADWGILFEGVISEDNIEEIVQTNCPLDCYDRAMVCEEMLYGTGYMLISRQF